MDYTTLTPEDRRNIAQDRLRGAESDHYRISITYRGIDVPPQEQIRLDILEEQATALHAEIKELDDAVKDRDAKTNSKAKK